jgi:signal transduction histidine kinase/CheY-like chemotaxis protein
MTSEHNIPLLSALNNDLVLQLISSLPVGIIVADLSGNLLYKNNVYERWIPRLIMENRLWVMQMLPFVDESQRHLLTDLSISRLLTDFSQPIELNVNHPGNRFFFRISFTPLYTKDSELSGILEVTENITELKELDTSLQHARRFETVGRLASGIAHDFNNILQVINGHSEMLLESQKGNERLIRSLDIILTSGQKASALTRQLLLFSRRQQGEFKKINLGNMISGMQKILSRMLGEDISMTTRFDDAGLSIEGDESQIEQIVMNLAINARDAMPEGGKINISTGFCVIEGSNRSEYPYMNEGSYVCLRFSDTGCGIPKSVLDHIFEPFFTTKESGHGTGLGLATVYSIIKQHRGYVVVESELNKGTEFILYFPLTDNQNEKTDDFECPAPSLGCDKTVLIIEDDDHVRELATAVLTQYGYCVTCAPDLKQARYLTENRTFDLFFIDIVLPDGDGVSFLESLEGENKAAAFILSSGYPEDKPQIRNTINKGYTFLPKPFTISLLLQACADALQKGNTCQ